MIHWRTGLAAAAAAVVLLLAVSCGGDSGEEPTAVTTLTPTEGARERPQVLRDQEVTQLRQGSELHIPGDAALIVEAGCFQCDGPTTGLLRVYTRADGSPVVDTLLDPDALGLGPRVLNTPKGVEELDPYITGFAVSGDASVLWASICVHETCGSGGLDSWSPGSSTALFRSADGGITWSRAGTVDVGGFVIELLDEDQPVIGTWDVDQGPVTFRTFPGMEELPSPTQAWPETVLDGRVIWRSADGTSLLRSDGSALVDFGPGARIYRVSAGTASKEGLMVMWSWRGKTDNHNYVSDVGPDGQLSATYEYPRFMMVAPLRLEKGHAIGNADFDSSDLQEPLPEGVFNYLPAVFDLADGTVNPLLDPFATPDFPRGRNHIVGVMRGFFSRVDAPGSCLNVREQPSLSAPVVDCAAGGVLLRGIGGRHGGETVDAEGLTWLHVLTPGGREGWTGKEFLEP